MIGKLDPDKRHVEIVGGGIGGLIAAYRVLELGYSVTIYEASGRLGGLIQTKTTPYGIAESAAHSILAGAEVLGWLQKLGVEVEYLKKEGRQRNRLVNGKWKRIPFGIEGLWTILWRAIFSKAPWTEEQLDQLTCAEWCETLLGKKALEGLVQPFLCVVYGTVPEKLLLKMVWPAMVPKKGESIFRTLRRNKKHKNKPKEKFKPVPVAPKLGMESLVKSLEEKIKKHPKAKIFLNYPIRTLDQLRLESNWILAVPSSVISKLLEKSHIEAALCWSKVPYSSLSASTVFLEKKASGKIPRGIGSMIPRSEKKNILGFLRNSDAFEGRVSNAKDYLSLTVMKNGTTGFQENFNIELEELFGISKKDTLEIATQNWEKAIPIYGTELQGALKATKVSFCKEPGRIIFGNLAGQVSIRGMIESALKLT